MAMTEATEGSTGDRPVVVITGCASGIGAASARLFAARGFAVFATVRRPGSADVLLAEAQRLGHWMAAPILDVTDQASVDAAMASICSASRGRIDVLVNNAGYYLYGPVEQTTPEELSAQLDTNVVGVQRVTRAVLPRMRAAGRGTIINLSSIAGRTVVPIVGPYHASKWALEALTEALRYEVARFGIRVVCVEPGPFKTELHTKEILAREAKVSDSHYAPLIAAYRRQLASLKRAEVERVAALIVKAAVHPSPRLRWRIGPTSMMGWARGLIPDWIYELAMRLLFRWQR